MSVLPLPREPRGRPLEPIRLANAGSCPSRQRDCVATAARSAETKGTAQLPCGSGETQGEGVGDGEISNAECGLACTYCELRTARTDRTGNYRDTGERREPHVAWVAGARAVLRVPQQGWAALHRGQGAQGAWGRLLDRLS